MFIINMFVMVHILICNMFIKKHLLHGAHHACATFVPPPHTHTQTPRCYCGFQVRKDDRFAPFLHSRMLTRAT